MSKKDSNKIVENLSGYEISNSLHCDKCGRELEFYYDDDGKLQSYCSECDKE